MSGTVFWDDLLPVRLFSGTPAIDVRNFGLRDRGIMGEFDGRKVLMGVCGIFLGVALLATAGPVGCPFFLFALIYTFAVSGANEPRPPVTIQRSSTLDPQSETFVQGFTRSREVVFQNATGERIGFRQQDVHWRYR